MFFLCFQGMSPISVFGFVLYIMASLTVFGLFFDNTPYACVFELARCMILVTYVQRAAIPDVNPTVLLSAEVFFLLSGIFWCLQSLRVLEITVKTKNHWELIVFLTVKHVDMRHGHRFQCKHIKIYQRWTFYFTNNVRCYFAASVYLLMYK